MTTKRFPEKIYAGDIVLKKISAKEESIALNELLCLYNKNRKHLLYWHNGIKQLFFRNTADMIIRFNKCRLICYAVYNLGKIIGCIEITKIEKYEEKTKHRTLSF